MKTITIISPEEIINDVELAIKSKRPFSLIRFGDGGLKVIDRFIRNEKFFAASRQEGIPLDFFDELVNKWVQFANEADYIDTCELYFEDEIHKKRRKVSSGNKELMSRWKQLFLKVGINIDRKFCSPEMGILFFVEDASKNLLDVIKDKKVCCITNFYETEKILSKYIKQVTVKLIPGFFGNHYAVSYDVIMSEIEQEAKDYDLWLIGAGELGRIYTGEIKKNGGRAVDIGKTFDNWARRRIDGRMKGFCTFSENHKLLFNFG